jgi:hypothetical protein
MTIAEILTKVRQRTNTDANSYTNATFLIDVNTTLQWLASIIHDSQDESDWDDVNYADYPSFTTALTTNRDYSIPQSEGVISIKKVSISYDGTNYYDAVPIDSGEVGVAPASATTANSTIDSQFTSTAPRYDVKYNSVFVYPKPTQADVDAGGQIYIEWTRDADPFTSGQITTGTKIPGLDTAFHPMLYLRPAYEYCVSKGKPQAQALWTELQDYEARLRRQYSKKVKDRHMTIKSPIVDYK